MNELEKIIKENDKYWRILKYNNTVLQIQIKNTNSIIENEHIVNITQEKNRVGTQSIENYKTYKYLLFHIKNQCTYLLQHFFFFC